MFPGGSDPNSVKTPDKNKKVSNSLVALSGAAILAVYSAGLDRTRSAANKFELLAADRMPARSGYEKYRGSANGLPPSVGTPLPSPPVTEASPEPVRELPNLPKPPAPPVTSYVTDPEPAQAPPPQKAEFPQAPVVDLKVAEPKIAELKIEAPPVAPPAPVALAPTVPARNTWKDGTYYGWGTSRHGDIQAAVVIEGGRIASATIAQCRTRYSCSVIDKLPPEVAQRQSPDVDYVSGATQSANAFYYAVVEALAQAK
jgi:uncharacterized protein with FMN-binding domain